MLHLIGIGAKKEHINPEMLGVIKKSDYIFLEYYTSFYQDSFEELEKYLDKKIILANRELIETKIEDEILEKAKTKEVSILILGDPLIATTHIDLLLRAKQINIETKIYNNISIGNHITRTGLQFYKFGKFTSIPFFNEKFMPRTPYLVYHDNHKMGAHSLFLLDLNPTNDKAYFNKDKFMSASKAFNFLLNIPKIMLENEEIEEKDSQIISEEDKGVICSRLGFDDEKIIYGKISELIKFDEKNNLKEPICIIIPGDLHEIEEQYLNQFKI